MLITPAISCHNGISLSFFNNSSNAPPSPPGWFPLLISPLGLSSGSSGSCISGSSGYNVGSLGSCIFAKSSSVSSKSIHSVSFPPLANEQLPLYLSLITAFTLYNPTLFFKSSNVTAFPFSSSNLYSTISSSVLLMLSLGGLLVVFQLSAITLATISISHSSSPPMKYPFKSSLSFIFTLYLPTAIGALDNTLPLLS